MVTSFDLHEIRQSTENDLNGLAIYLSQLMGEPFLFFRRTYGDELTIHLGAPVERTTSKLKNRVRGSYVLSLRASLWMMIAEDNRFLVLSELPKHIASSSMQKLSAIDIERNPLIKEGARLVSAMPIADEGSGGIALYLGFSDQTRFIIRPEPARQDEDADTQELPDIADWEMYTPIGRVLRVGPGRKWAYLPSVKEENS